MFRNISLLHYTSFSSFSDGNQNTVGNNDLFCPLFSNSYGFFYCSEILVKLQSRIMYWTCYDI